MNGTLSVLRSLPLYQNALNGRARCTYLVLAEGKGHSLVVPSNFDVAIAKDLENFTDRELKLLVGHCLLKTRAVSDDELG